MPWPASGRPNVEHVPFFTTRRGKRVSAKHAELKLLTGNEEEVESLLERAQLVRDDVLHDALDLRQPAQ